MLVIQSISTSLPNISIARDANEEDSDSWQGYHHGNDDADDTYDGFSRQSHRGTELLGAEPRNVVFLLGIELG